MSAYIIDPNEIKKLAIFAATRPLVGHAGRRVPDAWFIRRAEKKCVRPPFDDHTVNPSDRELAEWYGELLYQENIRSVRARYPDDTWDTLPGPTMKPIHIVISNHDMLELNHAQPLNILKACDSLEYQSCETTDYESTVAFMLLQAIRSAAIHSLPGYDDAPWI